MKGFAMLLLVSGVACQRYVALEAAPASVGTDVRVKLDADAAATSFSRIGSRVQQVEGRVVGVSDSTLAIGVTAVTRVNGLEDGWGGDTVVFRRSEIQGVEEKRISTSRTLLSVGGVVVGGFLAHAGLRGGAGTGAGQPPTGGGN
ncbi:MAG TPA: hypothetical protein VE110_10755 [Gemmatimonadaceae bacterium]|nr:hypothetical protein [Gemmatimonadaceae bacterium]